MSDVSRFLLIHMRNAFFKMSTFRVERTQDARSLFKCMTFLHFPLLSLPLPFVLFFFFCSSIRSLLSLFTLRLACVCVCVESNQRVQKPDDCRLEIHSESESCFFYILLFFFFCLGVFED
jgi:hypothetical protein